MVRSEAAIRMFGITAEGLKLSPSLGEGSHARFRPTYAALLPLEEHKLEGSTALLACIRQADLVSVILRGRAMQGNTHEARLSGHRRRSITRAAIVRTIGRPRT